MTQKRIRLLINLHLRIVPNILQRFQKGYFVEIIAKKINLILFNAFVRVKCVFVNSITQLCYAYRFMKLIAAID